MRKLPQIEASKLGGKITYHTGKPCRKGHYSDRYVSTRQCLVCLAEQGMKRQRSHRWRAKQRNAAGSHTPTELDRLFILQRSKCAYCRISLARGYEEDHIVPLALGGSDFISNIQLTCQKCNRDKRAKHPLVYAREIGLLL